MRSENSVLFLSNLALYISSPQDHPPLSSWDQRILFLGTWKSCCVILCRIIISPPLHTPGELWELQFELAPCSPSPHIYPLREAWAQTSPIKRKAASLLLPLSHPVHLRLLYFSLLPSSFFWRFLRGICLSPAYATCRWSPAEDGAGNLITLSLTIRIASCCSYRWDGYCESSNWDIVVSGSMY